MNCVVCKSTEVKDFFEKNAVSYKKCKICGMIFQHPMPSINQLDSYYQDGEKYWADERHSLLKKESIESGIKTSNFYISIIQGHIKLNKEMSVLDFGCGTGTFLHQIKPLVKEVKGIDMSAWSANYAKEKYGIEIVIKPLEQIGDFDHRFDLVTMWQTLEHIPNPDEIIQQLTKFLKPKGYLVIGVPNAGSLFARILGKRWEYYNTDEHILLFSPKTIKQYMETFKFSLIKTYRYSYSKVTVIGSIVRFLFFFSNRLIKRCIYKTGLNIKFGPINTPLWKTNQHLIKLPYKSSKDCMISIFQSK